MARTPISIVIPRKPDEMTTLSTNIQAKHAADGPLSPLPLNLMALLKAKTDEADAQFTEQKDFEQRKETMNQDRNLLLGIDHTQNSATEGTALYTVTSIRNYLLGQFRGAERSLGAWGFSVTAPKGNVNVDIPRNPEKLNKLVQDILKKHTADGSASILNVFDMAALQTISDDVAAKITEAAALNRKKEKATQARDLALGVAKTQNSKTPNTVAYVVRCIRDILLGMYRGREQSLGDWGFEVNSSTSTSTPPTDPPVTPG